MRQVIQLPAVDRAESTAHDRQEPLLRTETVYVLFTTIDETLAAVRVAAPFADAMGVPVTVVHLRTVPYALPVDEPTGISPVETEAFMERLRAEGVSARVRVCLCRDERRAIPYAFKPHSLIVMGRRHSWWPTGAERWRRDLEAAGHLVAFADTSDAFAQLGVVPSPRSDEPREAFRA